MCNVLEKKSSGCHGVQTGGARRALASAELCRKNSSSGAAALGAPSEGPSRQEEEQKQGLREEEQEALQALRRSSLAGACARRTRVGKELGSGQGPAARRAGLKYSWSSGKAN